MLLFIILGAVALAGMFLIWLTRKKLIILLRRFEKNKNIWNICLIAAVLAAFAYLYFIRPYIPNVHIDGGIRSFREESLIRLGWYISPIGIILCLSGFILFILKKSKAEHLFFILLVLFNFSLFLYDPNIYPEHFWAVRRYVPFIIPAAVVFTAVTIEELITLGHKWSKTLGTALSLLLIVYFGITARPFIFHTEYKRVGEQLEALAQTFDNNDIILTADTNYTSRLVGTPLDLIFDKNVLPLKNDYDKEILKKFMRDKGGQGYNIYFIAAPLDLDILSDILDEIEYENTKTVEINTHIAQPSLNYIPANTMERNWIFEIIQWKELQ
jgi:hypothetical protein